MGDRVPFVLPKYILLFCLRWCYRQRVDLIAPGFIGIVSHNYVNIHAGDNTCVGDHKFHSLIRASVGVLPSLVLSPTGRSHYPGFYWHCQPNYVNIHAGDNTCMGDRVPFVLPKYILLFCLRWCYHQRVDLIAPGFIGMVSHNYKYSCR
ncbi:MAG: hypothetical protein JST26_15465 [Bacteroidetes bacterium]|nr:hypothetical protein [Bacteroidota bacterium]